MPLIDALGVLPYAEIGAIHADAVEPMPTHEEHAFAVDLGTDAVGALLRVAGPASHSPQVIVEVCQLGEPWLDALTASGEHFVTTAQSLAEADA